jgi:uncharacterized pyridoxamine 5'-phosphate oxidase family protein
MTDFIRVCSMHNKKPASRPMSSTFQEKQKIYQRRENSQRYFVARLLWQNN